MRMLNAMDSDVEERWNRLWDASPQRSPFSRLDYVRAVADAAGMRAAVHFAAADGRDTGGAAVTWRRKGPYRQVIVPPFTPSSAILLNEALSESDVHARSTSFEQVLQELEEAYDAVQLHLPPSITDVRAAQWRGWSAEPLYTYRITSTGGSPREWSSSTARNYRTGRGAYEIVSGPTAAAAAATLAAESYARHGRKMPLDRPALEALAHQMAEIGLSTPLAVRHRDSGEIRAAVAALRSAGEAYYWIAGSRPGDAMTVLIGEMLRDLFESGVRIFDFMGANTASIAEFKRRFGANLVPYFRIAYQGRLDLNLLNVFRKMLR